VWLVAGLLSFRAVAAWAEAPPSEEPPRGAPDSAEAQSARLRREANEAYLDGRYDEALLLLERANALAPYALHSFNLGAVQHRLGRCELARDLFERYLRTDPEGPASGDARRALEELHAQCGRGPTVASSGPPRTVPQPAPAPAALASSIALGPPSPASGSPGAQRSPSGSAPGSEPRPSAREIAAWSSLAAGGAAAVVGVASAILMQRAEDDLEALARGEGRVWNAAEARALHDNGERYQALALAGAFGSALLLGAGVGLLLLDDTDASLGVRVSGDAALVYSRRF
jgi:tetratricopeptide (TPR) repeat protein